MSDPTTEGTPVDASTAEPRTRPGTQGLSTKSFLVLALVALLPLLALPFALWPLVTEARLLPAKVSEELKRIEEAESQLVHQLVEARKETKHMGLELNKTRRALRVQTELKELINRLAPLANTERSDEEILRDKGISAALKSEQDSFTEVLLIRVDPPTALLARSGKKGGKLSKIRPELARLFDAGKSPAPPERAGWLWRPLADGALHLAVKLPDIIPDTQPIKSIPRMETKRALVAVKSFHPVMAITIRSLLIALPLFGLLLAGLALWWWRSRFLRPARILGLAAREMLTSPKSVDPANWPKQDALADLAASLERLLQRMQRLEQMDKEKVMLADESLALKVLLERAAEGHLETHAESDPGPLQEVNQAFNRMLDRWTERAAGLIRQADGLGKSANQMANLIGELGPMPEATKHVQSTAEGLAELLGTQGLALCREADALLTALDAASTAENLGQGESGFESALAGFALMADRIAEATSCLDQVNRLRQSTEVLATNLAISAEADSPEQLDKMVEDARGLAREAIELNEHLGESLRQIEKSTKRLGVEFQLAGEQEQKLRKVINDRNKVGGRSAALRQRLEVVQPGLSSLASDLRRVNSRLEELEREQFQKSNTVKAVAQGAESLAEGASGLADELLIFNAGRPVPAAVTQALARQKTALTRSIDQLQQLARAEGIEELSPEASAILEDIQRTASEARKRIQASESPSREA
ncbi:MAG: hypothetical protein JRF33_21230 [Deltaproteobacteria bacterium]|nr:hypothetical protein [Deltaproteobacteria bacterium]